MCHCDEMHGLLLMPKTNEIIYDRTEGGTRFLGVALERLDLSSRPHQMAQLGGFMAQECNSDGFAQQPPKRRFGSLAFGQRHDFLGRGYFSLGFLRYYWVIQIS